MQRLIDAGEALELIDDYKKSISMTAKTEVAVSAIEDIVRFICPTIDAEPVIRCKDCRFGTQSKQEPKDYFVRCIQNPFYPEHFHKNHYCGFGLKKDEEQ